MQIPWKTKKPFAECQTCPLAKKCFYMRKDLSRYIYLKHCSPLGNRYPYMNNLLCEDCVMRPFDFKRNRNCRKCGGRGLVDLPKIRSGWRPYGPSNLISLVCVLENLPAHQKTAVERWIIHGELQYPVEEKKWMRRERGYRRQRQNPSLVYLLTPKQIAEHHVRTTQKRRLTRRAKRYFVSCLERGLRTLALEYEKFSFEEVGS